MQNIIEEDFVLGTFLFAKRNDLFTKGNGLNAKKGERNANNKSQKQKEDEKYTFHNIFNFIIAVI